MEEVKMMNDIGYNIGQKAKLHDFEILKLFELIRYDQYHDFFKQIISIARKVKVAVPEQLYKYDYETFEYYIYALWEGFKKSITTLELEPY